MNFQETSKHTKELYALFESKKNGIVKIANRADYNVAYRIVDVCFPGVSGYETRKRFASRENKNFPFAIRIAHGQIEDYIEPDDLKDINIQFTIEGFADEYIRDNHVERCYLSSRKNFKCAGCSEIEGTANPTYKGYVRDGSSYRIVLFCEKCAKLYATRITEIIPLGNGHCHIEEWERNYSVWHLISE